MYQQLNAAPIGPLVRRPYNKVYTHTFLCYRPTGHSSEVQICLVSCGHCPEHPHDPCTVTMGQATVLSFGSFYASGEWDLFATC